MDILSIFIIFLSEFVDQYHCPVTFKIFNENTHIVAIKPTGNVYSMEVCSINKLLRDRLNWINFFCQFLNSLNYFMDFHILIETDHNRPVYLHMKLNLLYLTGHWKVELQDKAFQRFDNRWAIYKSRCYYTSGEVRYEMAPPDIIITAVQSRS